MDSRNDHDQQRPVNHHAGQGGFGGLAGLLGAGSMLVGRGSANRLAAELTDLAEGDTVVDLGCGPGTAARLAAHNGATAIGVDPAPTMLRVARWATRSRRVRYELASAESLPLPDASATVVWAISTVHHWNDVDAALGEISRVLQPGGRFVAIERRVSRGAAGHASHGWTIDQADTFTTLCASVGLKTQPPLTRVVGRRTLVAVAAVAR
jgi:ubiquinone/menaquinone biosynthesis C-methylase UbiE